MNTEGRKDILNYEVLKATLKEVTAADNFILTKQIERILQGNQLPKPALHNRPNDITTTVYRIDLTADDIEEIINILIQLEAKFVNESGETTAMASFYASLVDTWNGLLQS